MLLDLIDLSKLRRGIVYALLLAACLILQNMIVSHITPLGVRALLIPALVVGVGLMEDGVWGGVLGLAAGYCTDTAFAGTVILFTVLLPAAGFFSGVLGKYMLHRGFVSFLVLTALTLAVIAFCQMFRFLFMASDDSRRFLALYLPGAASWPVLRTGLLQTLWSLALSIPIYLPCKLIAARPMGR